MKTPNSTLYDGYYKYDRMVAETYDSSRSVENHWNREDQFIEDYMRDRYVNHLLDLPVGTGRFFRHYTNVHRLTGVDISEEMLTKAQEKRSLLSSETLVNIEKGDVFNLQYNENEFDCVIVFRLFHLIPENLLDLAIKELCRVANNEIVVQTYVPLSPSRFKVRKILRALPYYGMLQRFRKLIQNMTDRTKARSVMSHPTTPSLPWSHIQAYNHDQLLFDSKFGKFGFSPSVAKLLDMYTNCEVRATVYSKKV